MQHRGNVGYPRGGGGGVVGGNQPQPQRQRQRNNRFRGQSRFDSKPYPNQYPRPQQQHHQQQQQQQQKKPAEQKPVAKVEPATASAPVAAPAPAAAAAPAPKPQEKQAEAKPTPTPAAAPAPAPAPVPAPAVTPKQEKPPSAPAQQQQQKPQNQNQRPQNQNQRPQQQNNQNQTNGPAGRNQNGPPQNRGAIGGGGRPNDRAGGGAQNRNNSARRFAGQDKQPGQDRNNPSNREEHFMLSKLKEISGPSENLQPLELAEQKFSGRNRLYIGNLTGDVTEEEILDTFNAFGETSELFVNKEKNFAFIRIDYKVNAERAKREVDGRMLRGRPLRVRFAPHNAAIKVKNLTPFVSNELLFRAFEIFGKIERAIVKVDERGKSLGEGVVEFVRKAGALAATRHCNEKCFFLTASLRPVVVESFDDVGELDGYTEKSLPRKNQEYTRARGIGPRFAEPGSFEHEYGTRWKQLYELYKQKEEALEREMRMEEDKLEAQMEYAKYEHETELLREQLRQREQDSERQKRTWEMAERQAEERREKERETIMRQQEDMTTRMRHQEDELRRRQQENTLFMQAQQLSRILDEQEQGMGGGRGYDDPMQDKHGNFDGPMGGSMQMDNPYMEHYDMMSGHMGYDDGMGRWESRQEDYPTKRRRY